jgi:glycosyltransferase involved in cell wall biosynthesis
MNAGRVLFLLKGYPRLSETFIAQEIHALEQAGLVIAIAALRRSTDRRVHPIHSDIKASVLYLPEYLHQEPLRVGRAVLQGLVRRRFSGVLAAFARDLRRDFSRNRFRRLGQAFVLANELPPDISQIHAHFIHTPGSVARYASLMTGLPWSCSAHAKDIWTSPDWELQGKLASARFAVTCTAAGQQKLNPLAPADRPVRLVYHGLDLSRFTPLAMPASTRAGTSDADKVRVLTVGRAVPKKGLDVLLEALALLPVDLHWHWTHIGGGEQLDSLRRLAKALQIDQRISWLGPQDQTVVLAHYRSSDVFVLPCRVADDGDRDGLPNVLVEAQSQSLACVSSPISGVPELIVDEVSGLLVPPNDSALLGAALARLARDPSLRRRLGAEGARRVHQSFSHGKAVVQLLTLFKNAGARDAVALSQSQAPA